MREIAGYGFGGLMIDGPDETREVIVLPSSVGTRLVSAGTSRACVLGAKGVSDGRRDALP
jgi:hypothetical protein